MSGGDWTDASVTHIVIRHGVDVESMHGEYRAWYEETYLPALGLWINQGRPGPRPVPYLNFPEWMIREGAARKPDKLDLLEFWEH